MQPVDVYQMARSGARLAGALALARLPRLGASLLRHDGELAYLCVGLHDDRDRPALHLALQARLALRCDRCGRELEFGLDVERRFYFVASEPELAAIEIDDAPEEALLGSARFDLAGLIEDEAILQLPLSPRHAHCAPPDKLAALAPEPRTSPFAALQNLRAVPDEPDAGRHETDAPRSNKVKLPRDREK